MAEKKPRRRPLLERYWEKIDKRGDDECWPWLGATNGSGNGMGHGQLGDGKGRGGKNLYAHHIAWSLAYGMRDQRLHVLHKCDNGSCCNPAHLELGTHGDNMRQMTERGRNRGLEVMNG